MNIFILVDFTQTGILERVVHAKTILCLYSLCNQQNITQNRSFNRWKLFQGESHSIVINREYGERGCNHTFMNFEMQPNVTYVAKLSASLPSPPKADSLHDISHHLQVFGMPGWVYRFLGK